MSRIPQQPNFARMNIAAGGTIHNALIDHRVLRTALRDLTFVIAHADDRERAIEVADESRVTSDTYTVLFTADHLAAIAADVDGLHVTVLDAQRDHQPAATQIKVNAQVVIVLSTEHGRDVFTAATTGDLRAGDMFTAGKFTADSAGREHGLTVYRALTDYNPDSGTIEMHIVTRNWDSASVADRANLTSTSTGGPDWIVYRAVDRAASLARLGLSDVASDTVAA